MKKLFISIIALVSAMTMSAQIKADVTLRLQSQSGSVCELYLFAGPDLAASPERGSFMANASNPEDVNIFALDPANNNRYASFGNETLVNIPVGIITSKEEAALQNYTIHFEVFEDAEVLKLKDLVTGTETDITNGGSYAFTIAAATDPSFVEGAYSVIANRFFINYNAAALHSVTTNAYGFCSFASSEDVEFLGGLKAYKGLYEAGTNELTLVEVGTKVPANTGVILWNSNEAAETFYYNVGVDAGAADVTGNDFVGVVAATDPAGISADIYCLHGNELQKYVGTDEIPAGKAYLPIASGSAAPHRIVMRFNDAQGIEDIAAEGKAVKFVENGQILIRRGNEVFNLQGQIVK
jgi:hypothetical protein